MMHIIKRYWLLATLAAITMILVLVQFGKTPPPTPSSSPHPTPQVKSKFGQLRSAVEINYSGPDLQIPPSLPTYINQVNNSQDLVQTLVTKMQLKPHPAASNLWTGQNYNLNYDPSSQSIIISSVGSTPATQGINQPKAISQAVDFVNAVGVSNIAVDKDNILLIGRNREFINVSPAENLTPENAYYAVIPFHFQINTYPLYYHDLPTTYLSAIVTNTGVIKATINPSINASPSSEKHTLAVTQALDHIRKGDGTFLYVDTGDPGSQITDNLIKINLVQSYLEYRLEPAGNQINPYIRFTGAGTTSDDKTVNLEIIVPAVEN